MDSRPKVISCSLAIIALLSCMAQQRYCSPGQLGGMTRSELAEEKNGRERVEEELGGRAKEAYESLIVRNEKFSNELVHEKLTALQHLPKPDESEQHYKLPCSYKTLADYHVPDLIKCFHLPELAELVKLTESVNTALHDYLKNAFHNQLAMCTTHYERRMELFQAGFRLYWSLIVDFTREAEKLSIVDGEPPEEAEPKMNEALWRLFESRVAAGSLRAGEYPWEVLNLPSQLKQACTISMEYMDAGFLRMAALPEVRANKEVQIWRHHVEVCHQVRRTSFEGVVRAMLKFSEKPKKTSN